MPGWRRSSLATAALVGLLSLTAASARAQGLTPGQEATERLFYIVVVPAIAIGILVMALVTYAVVKFRVRPGHSRGPTTAKTHDRKLEGLWTVIPALILLVVGIAAYQTLVVTDTIPPQPDVTVRVTGVQWAWSFNTTYANGTSTGPQSGAFTVAVGQVVKLVFEAGGERPVAHSFYIPAFGLKIDVMPGRENVYWFKALQAGDFEIHCAEFCGLRHYSMIGMLHVVS